jgi:hypothetical protein
VHKDYRKVIRHAMQAYMMFAGGRWRLTTEHTAFDHRFLDYCMDVQKVLSALPVAERCVLTELYENDQSHAEAAKAAGYDTRRPDALVAMIEIRAGKLLTKAGLDDAARYFKKEVAIL